MSTAPTASAPASTATAAAPSGHSKPRHGTTPESGSDLFASLLSLLSATRDPAGEMALGADTDASEAAGARQDAATDGSQNPLAALLGWPGAVGLPPAPQDGTASATASGTGNTPSPSLQALPGLASAASTPAQPGLSLQGMTPLATPTAPDADTLAALAQANATGAPASAESAGGQAATPIDTTPTPPRSLHWRSTAGSTVAAAAVAAQAQHSSPASVADGTQGVRQALAAQSRSTVALDERFGQSLANTAPVAAGAQAPVAASSGGAPHQDSGAGSPGGAPGQGGLDTLTGGPTTDNPEASAYAEATRELDDPSATHWGTPNLRHASLRVGEGSDDAIDIQLSLAGQEVQVEFRTDNAEARASLAQDASGSLGDLLQRSGIQLGSVSVGAQSQQHGEPGRSPEQTQPSLGRGRPATSNEAASTPAPVVRPRADGSRPLDLFV